MLRGTPVKPYIVMLLTYWKLDHKILMNGSMGCFHREWRGKALGKCTVGWCRETKTLISALLKKGLYQVGVIETSITLWSMSFLTGKHPRHVSMLRPLLPSTWCRYPRYICMVCCSLFLGLCSMVPCSVRPSLNFLFNKIPCGLFSSPSVVYFPHLVCVLTSPIHFSGSPH